MRWLTLALAGWAVSIAGAAESVPALPEAFSSFGACVTGDFAYVYGGHAGRTHTYSTETTLGKLRRLPLGKPEAGWEELPGGVACQGTTLVAHAGKLYRLGGMRPRNAPGDKADNVSLASCGVYDIASRTWERLPDLPAGRSSFDAAVVDTTIVAIGGWHMKGQGNSAEWHDTALLLDLSKKPLKWESVPQPFKRRALTVAALAGKVYVAGGMNDENELDLRVDVFDLATRTWSRVADLPGELRNGFTPATCVLDGRLFVSPPDGVIYRLNTDSSSWERVASLAVPRMVHRILPAGPGRLLALGGAGLGGNVSLPEFVQIAPRQPQVTSRSIVYPGQARQMLGVLPRGDSLVLFGGSAQLQGGVLRNPALKEVYRVRLGDLSVTRLADLPDGYLGCNACLTGSDRAPVGLALGGMRTDAQGKVLCNPMLLTFPLTSSQWTGKYINWPKPRTMFATVRVGREVWLVGGLECGSDADSCQLATTILRLDEAKGEIVATDYRLPRGRKWSAAAVLDSKLYVVGGEGLDSEPVEVADVLDLTTGQWATIPAPKAGRAMPDLVAHCGKLYLGGGLSKAASQNRAPFDRTIEVYDFRSARWSTLVEKLPGDGQVRLTAMAHHLLASNVSTDGRLHLSTVQLPE